MFRLSKINPMVRAIGTMGAVAALVGGITYAQINSSPVSLTGNTLDSATVSLAIEADAACEAPSATSVPGMDFTNLIPNTPSNSFTFCLENTGGSTNGTPLDISMGIPANTFLGSQINPSDVNLAVTCGTGGTFTGAASYSGSLATIAASSVSLSTIPLSNVTSNVWSCQATATLDGNVTTSGATVSPFDLQFVGTSIDAS